MPMLAREDIISSSPASLTAIFAIPFPTVSTPTPATAGNPATKSNQGELEDSPITVCGEV